MSRQDETRDQTKPDLRRKIHERLFGFISRPALAKNRS